MSSQQVEQIKQRVDIVDLIQSYVKLEKSGINFRGRCPFHQERTPSFFVSPTRQTWRCFGCNKGGDHFTFIEEIEGLEFPDALKMLADRAGIKLVYEDPKIISERSRLYAICEEAAKFFETNLGGSNDNRATPMLQYLLSRGLTEETIKNFRIGYATESWDALLNHLTRKGYKGDEIEKTGLIIKKDLPPPNVTQYVTASRNYYDRYRNRIIFPIADSSGRIIGFGGRIFPSPNGVPADESGAKYINSPETVLYSKSHILYAFDKAKQAIREKNQCIVVEGYMDTVMAHQAGAMNTVAVSGTALTPDQLKIISRLTDTVIFSFDMDSAGQTATKRSLELAADFNLQRKVLLLPSGKDPADAVRENPEIFLTSLQNARPLMDYYFEEAGKRYDIKDPLGKKNAGLFFLPHIRALKNEIERAHWLQKFASLVSVPELSVRQEMDKLPRVQPMHGQVADLKQPAPMKKTKRDLLEERLIALHLENPELYLTIEKEFDEQIPFMSLSHARLLQEIREHAKPITPELVQLYDTLQFEREALEFNKLKLDEEIRGCMKSVLAEHYKEQRTILQQQIQHLEKTENKDTMAKLLAEFNAIAGKVTKYSA